jgi:O-antigen/teichoic acid export membrane protein
MNIIHRISHFLVSDNLKARCAKSCIPLSIGAFTAKLVALASKLILAKILVGDERGLMIIILPLVTFFNTLTEIGIKQSVIQHKDGATEPYLNMAWWIQTVRGGSLYLLAFFLSPFLCKVWVYGHEGVSDYYSQTDILWMVRISFLTILLNGLVSPRSYVLIKEFRFGKSVLLVQGCAILSGVLTIVLAVVYRNVWAFVIGTVSNTFLLFVFSFIMCPFRPRWMYDSRSFHALVRFSKGMVGLPILSYLVFNLDVLVGSLFVSPALIGMYGFAMVLARTPREILTRIFGPPMTPAFAEKQDEPQAICKALILITKGVCLVILPLTTYLLICRDSVLTICYKPEFTEVAIPFSLLCLTYMILLQTFTLGKVFFGLGLPEKHRTYVIIRAVLLGGLIWPAAKYCGLLGITWLMFISNLIAFLYQAYSMKSLIGLNIKSYFKAWIPGCYASGILLILLIVFQLFWPLNMTLQFWGGGCLLAVTLGAVGLNMALRSRHFKSETCQS